MRIISTNVCPTTKHAGSAALAALALAWLVPAGPAHAASSDPLATRVITEIRARLPAALAEHDTPGAAVAVVDDHQILWQASYGRTARKGGTPIGPRTLFSIQSMSKSFTALAVLTAVQDGLLDLDAPITDYVPDFTVHSRFEEHPERKITLRHLLSHHAGFTHEAPAGSNFESRPVSFAEHVMSISDTWMRVPVGYRFAYSNLGIDLAGWILEKKTGVPFAEYVRQKVLVPIGMRDSTMDIDAVLEARDRALGHTTPKDTVPDGIPVRFPMIPAGGVYTNALDMARYLMFHINGGRVDGRPLLRADLWDARHSIAFPEVGQRQGYGLGIGIDRFGREVCYHHGGSGYGFGAQMLILPGSKLGVVYLTNAEDGFVAGAWIQELLRKLLTPTDGSAEREAAKPLVATGHPVPVTDPRVKSLVARYRGGATVELQSGTLGITIESDDAKGGKTKAFHPLSFYEDGGAIVGLYEPYGELRVKPALLEQPGTLVVLDRLTGTAVDKPFLAADPANDRPGPDEPRWRAYCGQFKTLDWGRSDALAMKLTVAVDNGYLTLNGNRCMEYVPGLFFTTEGEALDFRGTVATFRNILLVRTSR